MATATSPRLLFRNTMLVHEGHLDEYRAAIERAVGFAEEHAPQVMVDVFIDEVERRATSFQIYEDSDAVRRHWQLSDPYIQDVMAHCVVEQFEVFGTPDEGILRELTAGDLPLTIHPRLTGFLRRTGPA